MCSVYFIILVPHVTMQCIAIAILIVLVMKSFNHYLALQPSPKYFILCIALAEVPSIEYVAKS